MTSPSTTLVDPGGTAPVSEPQASERPPGDPRGLFAPSGTFVTSSARDLNVTSRSGRKAPAGAGMAPGMSPKDGLRVMGRAGTTAIPASRPALCLPGPRPGISTMPVGETQTPRPELFLAVFPPWFRLAYRVSESFRDMVDELLMEGPF